MAISPPMPRCCWPRPRAAIRARWRSRWSPRCRPSGAVEKVEIAGPGFINFHLTPAAWQQQVRDVLGAGDVFGHNASAGGKTVGVEYVSANPTGPLHVGHGRAAVIGDCIARVHGRQRLEREARVLLQRCRRADREPGAVDPGAREGPEARRRRLAGGRPTTATTSAMSPMPTCAATASRSMATSSPRQARPGRPRCHPRASAWPGCAASRTRTWPRTAWPSTCYFLESSLYTDGKVEETVRELDRPWPHLRGRRRAVAAHHRLRRRQGPRDAQVRRQLTPTSCRTSPIT